VVTIPPTVGASVAAGTASVHTHAQ